MYTVASPEWGVSWALEGECKEKGSAAHHQAEGVREGTQGGGHGGLEKRKTRPWVPLPGRGSLWPR